jgi:ribonuclease BN (tRNA processing enzyme)
MSTIHDLHSRLSRYLSPPLFPVRLRELPNVYFHDVSPSTFDIDGLTVKTDLVLHPGTTLGYRISENGKVLAYIPDHEPALGDRDFPCGLEWLSGRAIAEGADVLIHDAQYTDKEYEERTGWGHSSLTHVARYAETVRADRLVTFHHDPSHTDADLDGLHEELADNLHGPELLPGSAHLKIEV